MTTDILHTGLNSNSKVPNENPAGLEVLNGPNGSHKHYAADPEAQDMVIESLRIQIQDLFSQVTQLNSKLVKSYDRVSDLEDALHVASAQLRSSSLAISDLEFQRTQHLAALNTGLLVEKDHVTAELNRLMEKATDEAAQRGQAESARAAIEKDLDDLSASLFNQANTMVAEARYAQSVSYRKAEDAEQALRGAEEAVSAMQQQMQALQEEKESAERKSAEAQYLLGKGKWIDRRDGLPLVPPLRLFSFHLPYQEFLSFIAHLRHLHLSSPNPPAMSTLLPLPFLMRLSSEDSEPTVRLDLAPSLNWLSRRSVLAAIHSGQLTIEPMSFTALLMESSHLSHLGISNSSSNEYIPCALCGASILPRTISASTGCTRPSVYPLKGIAHSYSGSGYWSSSIFKKNSTTLHFDNSSSPSVLPQANVHTTQAISNITYPSQVHIFRISPSQTSSLPQLPLLKSSVSVGPSSSLTPPSSSQNTLSRSNSSLGSGSSSQSSSTIYPLCTNGWCLSRLRTTCSMWAFVRTSIIERIWEEEPPAIIHPPVLSRETTSTPVSINLSNSTNRTVAPPVPPRKRGLWGLANAIRTASWSESSSEKAKRVAGTPALEVENKTLPPPSPSQERPNISTSEATALASSTTSPTAPPPLPKRSKDRTRDLVNSSSPPSTSSAVQNSNVSAASPAVEPASIPAPIVSPSAAQPAEVAAAPPSTPLQTPTRPQAPQIPPRAAQRFSASFSRPCTPSNIPLPNSRPETPVAAHQPPLRTSSPAFGSTNGTPPPIPRRALARTPGKPLGEVGGDNSQSSFLNASVSPSKAGDVQTQIIQSQSQPASVNEIIDKSEDKKETEEFCSLKAPEVPKGIELKLSVHSNASAFSEPDIFVDAEEGAQIEDVREEVEVRTVKEVKEINGTHKEITGDIAEETKQEEAVTSQLLISLNNQELSPSSNVAPAMAPRRSKQKKEAEPGDVDGMNGCKEEDPSGNHQTGEHLYVGETTWEEKIWKELTKLKEEMFLARVGAVRS